MQTVLTRFPFSSDNVSPRNLEIFLLLIFFKRRHRTCMKGVGLTHPEFRCLFSHTNGMQQQLFQKLRVCCAVHMPQHWSGRITLTEKKESSFQSRLKLSSVKIIRKVLVSANCDDSLKSMNTLQFGRGQRGYTKSTASTSDRLLNHDFFGF